MRVLLHAVMHDAVDGRRNFRIGRGQLRWLVIQDRAHQVRGSVAAKRALAAKHFVDHRAEAENIAARVGYLTAHLLGRHVAERTHHHADLRAAVSCRSQGRVEIRLRRFGLRELRESKVQNLHASVVGNENVVGLDVAMDDAALVSRCEPARDLNRVLDGFALAHRSAAGEFFAQRPTFEQFRNDVRRLHRRPCERRHARRRGRGRQDTRCATRAASGVNERRGPDVEYRENVGMVQRSDGLRFLLEPAEAVLIVRQRRGQNLDGDFAPQPPVARAIHLAHSARADERLNFVRPKFCSGSERQGARIIPQRWIVSLRVPDRNPRYESGRRRPTEVGRAKTESLC